MWLDKRRMRNLIASSLKASGPFEYRQLNTHSRKKCTLSFDNPLRTPEMSPSEISLRLANGIGFA